MPTFTRWLLTFRGQDSAWGDLARDVAADPKVRTPMGYRALREHIHRMSSGNVVVMATLDEMYDAWVAARAL